MWSQRKRDSMEEERSVVLVGREGWEVEGRERRGWIDQLFSLYFYFFKWSAFELFKHHKSGTLLHLPLMFAWLTVVLMVVVRWVVSPEHRRKESDVEIPLLHSVLLVTKALNHLSQLNYLKEIPMRFFEVNPEKQILQHCPRNVLNVLST